MCKALDDLMADSRKAGLVEGLDRGENRMGILSEKLIISNRTEDLLRASRDKRYRRELMKEFGIVQKLLICFNGYFHLYETEPLVKDVTPIENTALLSTDVKT